MIPELYFHTASRLLDSYRDGYQKTFFAPDWTIQDNNLLTRVQNNIFAFSGAKAYAQLQEMRDAVYQNGTLTPWADYKRKARAINHNYNLNYLDAERNLVMTAGTQGSRWLDIQQTRDTHPYLIYETAGDEHVREEHRPLHGIILHIDDAFWLYYYPPNGWRCRCRARKLTPREYQHLIRQKNIRVIDSEQAQKIAGKAVAKPFRHNVGITEIFQTDGHPYFRANAQARASQLSAVKNFAMPPAKEIYQRHEKLSPYKREITGEKEYRDYWSVLEHHYGSAGNGFSLTDRENNIIAHFDNQLKEKMIKRGRHTYFDEAVEIFQQPDEIWGTIKNSKKQTFKPEYFNVYIKYYQDKPIVLMINKYGRVDSLYKLDTIEQAEQFRSGLLKQKR